MRNKTDIKHLVLGAMLGAAITLSIGAAAGGRTNWEYKILHGKLWEGDRHLGDAINSTVAQGWDLVSTSHSGENWAFAVLRREKK